MALMGFGGFGGFAVGCPLGTLGTLGHPSPLGLLRPGSRHDAVTTGVRIRWNVGDNVASGVGAGTRGEHAPNNAESPAGTEVPAGLRLRHRYQDRRRD
ncbi:hypothetical protein GCM10009839_85370 [Catenulispora yoronensis]|uniref:Sulphur transport domain-containing protein n=1 Tax=Catenulispora yoronensis TaxID=450799 RepID=A0ABN2VFL8_9ACTN